MAIPHAQPGQIIDVRPLGKAIPSTKTATLAKTSSLELIRLVLPAGKAIAEHNVAGEVTVQCLEGSVEFKALGTSQQLNAGQLLCLPGGEPHAVKSLQDATLLVTILFP
jgi:quercetin dioxygenase-like cupin family protein